METACIAAGEPGKRRKSSQCEAEERGRQKASRSPGDAHQGTEHASTSWATSDPSVKRKTSKARSVPSPEAGPVSTARIKKSSATSPIPSAGLTSSAASAARAQGRRREERIAETREERGMGAAFTAPA